MANSIIVFLLLTLFVFGTAKTDQNPAPGSTDVDLPTSNAERGVLSSTIQTLESQIKTRSDELKAKDELIVQKEKIILEKADIISSLQNQLSSLKEKRKLDADEKFGRAHARANELEEEVDKLRRDLATHVKDKEALETRVRLTEKKSSELNEKIKNLQSINDKQKARIEETARALKVFEEELIKVKFETSSVEKELKQVHGAWLPPWVAEQLIYYQDLAQTIWREQGKPYLEMLMQKLMQKISEAEKWANPHIEVIKTEWMPAAKDHLVNIRSQVHPHLRTLSSRATQAYATSKTAISPHLIKAQEYVDPYYQEAKKLSKPYFDQVTTVTKPHVEKARVILQPYTKQATHMYNQFLKSASDYHRQVQSTVRKSLEKHELTRPLAAANEFLWLSASTVLAMPFIVLSRTFSALLCKQTKKPSRNGRSSHSHSRRKPRRHSDK